MVFKISNPNEIDCEKLMSVYEESNRENAAVFYPQITNEAEAIKAVEIEYCRYIKEEFLNGGNIYYVLEENGKWVCALRLYLIRERFYYLEALETMPKLRNKGYATGLFTEMINELKTSGKFTIYDCVSKKNISSLCAHKKCGFKIIDENGFDHVQNEIDDGCYGLEYSY